MNLLILVLHLIIVLLQNQVIMVVKWEQYLMEVVKRRKSYIYLWKNSKHLNCLRSRQKP